MEIEPDTKDWTWVLEKPCPACGFVAGAVVREDLGGLVRENADGWRSAMEGTDPGDLRARPRPGVWSTLEYACHVRDVHRVFAERLDLMLGQEDPVFANWDQDEAAVVERYAEQGPGTVLAELLTAASTVAGAYDAVAGDQWQRPGRRSNGSAFTVESMGRYHLHDVVHHLVDVEGTGQ